MASVKVSWVLVAASRRRCFALAIEGMNAIGSSECLRLFDRVEVCSPRAPDSPALRRVARSMCARSPRPRAVSRVRARVSGLVGALDAGKDRVFLYRAFCYQCLQDNRAKMIEA